MDKQLLALFQRYFWESENILFVYTRCADLLEKGRAAYNEVHGIGGGEPAAAAADAAELLVAAALAAESQMERENWGWTLRIPFRRCGLFCGVDPDGTLCCGTKVLPVEASKDVVGAVAVQRAADGGPTRQSMLIPRDTAPHLIVEQYFDESEQIPARVAIDRGTNEALMALRMPDAHWDKVESLSEADLLAKFRELLDSGETDAPDLTQQEETDERLLKIRRQYRLLQSNENKKCGQLLCTHESVYYYGCRCSEEQMRNMINSLPASHREELWKDVEELEIVCPRCGRKHIVHKL